MNEMNITRWQVTCSVNNEDVKSSVEVATTGKAAIAKLKRKMRGAVSSAGAFKFRAERL